MPDRLQLQESTIVPGFDMQSRPASGSWYTRRQVLQELRLSKQASKNPWRGARLSRSQMRPILSGSLFLLPVFLRRKCLGQIDQDKPPEWIASRPKEKSFDVFGPPCKIFPTAYPKNCIQTSVLRLFCAG